MLLVINIRVLDLKLNMYCTYRSSRRDMKTAVTRNYHKISKVEITHEMVCIIVNQGNYGLIFLYHINTPTMTKT